MALVRRLIRPSLSAVAMLHVVFPLSNITGAIGRSIQALSMGLIIKPNAFIIVTVGVPKLALAIRHISQPLTLVLVSVFENLNTIALSLAVTVNVAGVKAGSILL